MRPQEIEQTSKKYKAHMVMGVLLICIGIIMIVGSAEVTPAGPATTFIGLIWLLAAKVAAWWNHG